MPTTKLGLPTITGNMTANIPRDVNALAEAIDAKAGSPGGLATLDENGNVSGIDTSELATKEEFNAHLADYEQHVQSGSAHGIGDKTKLLTTDKTTIVAAINEAFQSASDGKTRIANAVTAKGVAASPSDTFPTLATKIGQISTGKKMVVINFTTTGSTYTIAGLSFTPSLFLVINNTTKSRYFGERMSNINPRTTVRDDGTTGYIYSNYITWNADGFNVGPLNIGNPHTAYIFE